MTTDNPRPALGNTPSGGPIQVFFAKPGSARKPRIVRGEGLYMWDDTGRRYIDVSSGPVANNLGHGNARVLAAMQRQADEIHLAVPGVAGPPVEGALAHPQLRQQHAARHSPASHRDRAEPARNLH